MRCPRLVLLALPLVVVVACAAPERRPHAVATTHATPAPDAGGAATATHESPTAPVAEPTVDPTAEPTAEPTVRPTAKPTAKPTAGSTAESSADPTAASGSPTGASEPVASTPAPAPPLSPTDLRPAFLAYGLPPRSQGPRPTCSIFTTVGAFEFACARATGHGERLSAEYLNWAANAATGRTDDGDFFHVALAGWNRFGICSEDKMPYAAAFSGAAPSPDALFEAGKRMAAVGDRLSVRWVRPIDGTRGLSPAQFDEVVRTIASGYPVAAGAAHSRLLIGYREDAARPGGGVFLTLDSALAAFAEVDAAFVREQICDAFAVEVVDDGGRPHG